MRVAVSSWSWHEAYYAGLWSLMELPAGAKASGISLIECNDFMLPPPRYSRLRRPLLATLPGAPPEWWRYSRRSLALIREACSAHSVRVLAWTVNSDFTVSRLHWPAQSLYLRMGAGAARSLGARLLRLNLGGSSEPAQEVDGLVVKRLVDFVRLCERRWPELAVTVENHWGMSSDIARHTRIVAEVKQRLPATLKERIGCCFDPGNVPEGERAAGWARLAACANHFHFKTTAFDDEGRDDSLPHRRILALLQASAYQGDMTIEFQGRGEAEAGVRNSIALLRRLLADGGANGEQK